MSAMLVFWRLTRSGIISFPSSSSSSSLSVIVANNGVDNDDLDPLHLPNPKWGREKSA